MSISQDIVDRAKHAGDIAEEIERWRNFLHSFTTCRAIHLGWENDDAKKAGPITIGRPAVNWVNSEVYDGIHGDIMHRIQARIADMESELQNLMSQQGDQG